MSLVYNNIKYLTAGDRGLIIEFGDRIEEEANIKIRSMILALEAYAIPGIIEMVPAYRSIMIIYDPMAADFEGLVEKIKSLEAGLDKMDLPGEKIIEIPTIYGDMFGPDIEFVAEYNKIPVEEVIRLHTLRDYLIYMMGFTPGFPYLGGMSEKIAAPRLDIPRTRIPAGSVGIAGSQTGIYPIESPGGWRLIGCTPVKLYDPYRPEPFLLKAGNYIRFRPIDKKEYDEITYMESRGQYKVKVAEKDRR